VPPCSRSARADQLLAVLNANQAIATALGFVLEQAEWQALGAGERRQLFEFRKLGVGLRRSPGPPRSGSTSPNSRAWALSRCASMPPLPAPAGELFTDLHTADIAPYVKRFDLELCATGVIDEQQLLSLFEDGIMLVQGPHVGRPGPIRADLVVDRRAEPARRVEA
jgi:cyclic-di-GMP phosphodiesterase TipF (flagellum assembly factor)